MRHIEAKRRLNLLQLYLVLFDKTFLNYLIFQCKTGPIIKKTLSIRSLYDSL